jgi:1,2-diacylglycerol-3-alpha-glucose alpha-1,2-galactosyltransferase
MHYHTIDFKHYLAVPFARLKGINVGYVHFLPETLTDSIKLPLIAEKSFYKYLISFYKKMDYLVTVNPYFIKLLENYKIDKGRITFIPNFVSDAKFFPYDKEKKAEVKRRFNIEENCFTVLGVGQIQTRKGVLDFIEVANSLPNVQFVWAGGFSFGAITAGYKELKEVVANPPDNVKFLGIVERDLMNDIYNMSDLLFMPSFNELFPMTILEAFNCKLPILLRDLDIYNDVFFDFYLKGNDVKDFESIIKQLSSETEYYEKWSSQSWKGHELYCEDNVLRMWKDFYGMIYRESLLKNARRNTREKENI